MGIIRVLSVELYNMYTNLNRNMWYILEISFSLDYKIGE